MRDFTKLNLRNNKKKLKLYTDTHGGNKKRFGKAIFFGVYRWKAPLIFELASTLEAHKIFTHSFLVKKLRNHYNAVVS